MIAVVEFLSDGFTTAIEADVAWPNRFENEAVRLGRTGKALVTFFKPDRNGLPIFERNVQVYAQPRYGHAL